MTSVGVVCCLNLVMKLVVVLCCAIVMCKVITGQTGLKKNKLSHGVEFPQISRPTLLKILAAFEENIHSNLKTQRLKPLFTAQFANNQHTKKFIYPDISKRRFWTRTSWIQLVYGVWVNLAQLEIGLAFGFPAVQVPQLSSRESLVKITREDASWIASVLTLFSPIGCMMSGYLMDRFGRRIMLILCQGPMCVGWLYTGLARSAKHIIIGRAITGIGCGMAMGPPRIYSTEISLPNMRGVIGAFPSMAISIGISVQAGLGGFIEWKGLCYFCSIFSFANLIIFNLLPETPYYVLKTETPEKARIVLKKFRATDYDIEKEMKQLIEFKMDNNIRKLTVLENLAVLFTRASCKPFTLMSIYIIITQASGVNCIVMWAVEILQSANSSMDAHFGNFLLAITRLVVGTITSILLFSVGRKPLALTSAIGVSAICLGLGFYIRYYDEPSIIPQLCFMGYIAFASLGYYTLPYLMAAELYPLQVRGTLGGLTVSLTSLLIFATTKLFPVLRDNLGLANTIVIFGGVSLIGAAFLYFFLPETKELTLQEIEEYYNELRPTLISQRRIESMQVLHQHQKEEIAKKTSKRRLATKASSNKTTLEKVSEHASAAKLEAQKKLSILLGRNYGHTAKSNDKLESSIESLQRESVSPRDYLSIHDAFKNKESKKTEIEPESVQSSTQSKSVQSKESTEKSNDSASDTDSVTTRSDRSRRTDGKSNQPSTSKKNA